MLNGSRLVVRAIRTRQGGHELYAFFAPGARLLDLAEIPRLEPAQDGRLAGFQRPQIRQQVRAIADYLRRGSVLFPNAIILALSPEVRFVAARGSKPSGVDTGSDAGTLTIPLDIRRSAGWIVDGQQRTLALAEIDSPDFSVPVIAFISRDIAVHREQFILVNKARPLPARLIDELLPEVSAQLPRDLSIRKLPSALCTTLNESKESPFCGIIKRPSGGERAGVIVDSSLTKVMRKSIQDPRGALAAHVAPDGTCDPDAMFDVMVTYWSAVRDTFPEAWGLTADRSRLMHSAGIEAMGILMDQIMTHHSSGDAGARARATLRKIQPHCRWTSGRWETLERRWDEIQSTPRDVRMLSNFLVTLEREVGIA